MDEEAVSMDTESDTVESDSDDDLIREDQEEDEESNGGVYLPGADIDQSQDDVRPDKLVCDESTYVMLHKAHTGAPCLSFDILHDPLGEDRTTFPMTAYLVCGTQAEKSHVNSVIVMKMHNMHRNEESPVEEDDDDEEETEEEESKKPKLHAAAIKHPVGAINRIRATEINGKSIAASWSERGLVYIWDLSSALHAVNDAKELSKFQKAQASSGAQPLFSFSGHGVEGFAMDWSSMMAGQLLTGDCNKNIHLWKPYEGSSWSVDQRPFVGHTSSVEDIQWSPNEASVFASCSVDKSIRVWDIRAAPSKACMLTSDNAHDLDINVLSWNRNDAFLVSGGDDGITKIWDLRQFKGGKPVALFKHHTSAITSVEWHPTDSSVFGAAGADNQITLWDLAVERDEGCVDEEVDVPPQLLFVHQGQSEIKEIHWHKQCPGVMVSTAHSGFNIFRTISV